MTSERELILTWARALARADAGARDAWARVVAEARAQGETSAVATLVRRAGLEEIDLMVALALFAVEVDAELGRARPTLGGLAALLGGADPERREAVRRALTPRAPLPRLRLVLVASEGPLHARQARLADRVVHHLLGDSVLDETIAPLCRLARALPSIHDVLLPDEVIDAARQALELVHEAVTPAPRLCLFGPAGAGKTLLVEALAADAGRMVLRADLGALLADGEKLAERMGRLAREATLRGAVLLLRGGDAAGDERVARPLAERFGDLLHDVPVPVVVSAHERPPWLAPCVPGLVELAVPAPGLAERHELWKRHLPPATPVADRADLLTLAGRYSFSGGTIARAAEYAAARAMLRPPGERALDLEALSDAARRMVTHRLAALAERIPAAFTMDDLALPAETADQLDEVIRFARYRDVLLESWGFARKLPYGRGISVAMAGPPGTGKTMVAQLLAKQLGYELYRIDLSQVVSKFIGETEKNLAHLFDEARASQAILFFDEADALFSRRTEAKSSTDKYSNLEVNFLLQKMESYDGITLLATNLQKGLDEAFRRRVRFWIEFEMPDAALRERLWRKTMPAEAPVEEGLDYAALAREYTMAGGHIKKAVVRAALMAVSRGPREPVTQADLRRAAKLEYREMGRVS